MKSQQAFERLSFTSQRAQPCCCSFLCLARGHRLPEHARNWLAEDAIYLITREERCEFLLLGSDVEREQFMEQFWYRRAGDEISLDYDFKTEFYRRIVFANEKYGGKMPAGRNTDRGRLYVIFGAATAQLGTPRLFTRHLRGGLWGRPELKLKFD
jgi:GWxTD domain-containing protein